MATTKQKIHTPGPWEMKWQKDRTDLLEALQELLRASAYVLTEKDSDLAIARNKAAGVIYKATNSM